MDIGIGTYSLLWEWHEKNPHPLPLTALLDRAAELKCDVFQICDYPAIETFSAQQLSELRAHAATSGLRLELGTRGIDPAHLTTYLDIAEALGVTTLRSMVQAPDVTKGHEHVVATLRHTLPRLEATGITLALETYEQLPTATLVSIVTALASPFVGVCLDPANCVSALEHPNDVINTTALHVKNLHVKDFRFDRQAGWIGFTLNGARMGDGLLDLHHELNTVYRDGRSPSAIVEHWLPWQGDLETTLAIERDWTNSTLSALRDYRDAQIRPR
ncbi:MAG: sugar phosphate isomerase/epimerase family protein [Leucobacter sp.]